MVPFAEPQGAGLVMFRVCLCERERERGGRESASDIERETERER